jgi:hypothetical protein
MLAVSIASEGDVSHVGQESSEDNDNEWILANEIIEDESNEEDAEWTGYVILKAVL